MPADRELVERLELADCELTADYVESYARLFPDSRTCLLRFGGGIVSFAGVGSPLSRISGLGLAAGVGEDVSGDVAASIAADIASDFETAERFLLDRGVRPAVEVCPFTPRSLFDLLGAKNYAAEEFLNVYSMSLAAPGDTLPGVEFPGRAAPLPGDSPAYGPSGKLSVRMVDKGDARDSETWSLTVARGFASMDGGDPPWLDLFQAILGARSSQGFMAEVDGKPAGAGLLKVTAGIAYLSTTSTLPAYRKRGIQGSLLRARLEHASGIGCDVAAIMADPGSDSERNIRRAGFSLSYSRLRLKKVAPALS